MWSESTAGEELDGKSVKGTKTVKDALGARREERRGNRPQRSRRLHTLCLRPDVLFAWLWLRSLIKRQLCSETPRRQPTSLMRTILSRLLWPESLPGPERGTDCLWGQNQSGATIPPTPHPYWPHPYCMTMFQIWYHCEDNCYCAAETGHLMHYAWKSFCRLFPQRAALLKKKKIHIRLYTNRICWTRGTAT